MNTRIALSLVLLVLACRVSTVLAADTAATATQSDCNPFPPGALSRWGYADQPIGAPSGGRIAKESLQDAPTQVDSEICTIFRTPGKREAFVWIQAERFGDDADEAAIKRWIEAESEKVDADMKVVTTQVDGVTCDRGTYVIDPTAATSPTQYYVACDRLLGRKHFAINVQQPEGAGGLPTSAEVAALLKSAIARLQGGQRPE